MNNEFNLEDLEKEAAKRLFPELKEYLDYSTKIYNLCFKIQNFLDKKTIYQVGDLLRSQMMILMRITDFLRCIQHNIVIGYPQQAGTLASSIFELVHTAIYFTYKSNAMQNWLNTKDDKKKMPKLIGINTYHDLIKYNYHQVGLDPNPEILVYNQLCWMKHSHPILQDVLIKENLAKFQIGPYTDEISLNYALYTIIQSGRLTEMLITHISFSPELISDIELNSKNDLQYEISKIRYALDKKAQKRFQQ